MTKKQNGHSTSVTKSSSKSDKFSVQKRGYNVTRLVVKAEGNKTFLHSLLWLSDLHIDSSKCNRDVLTNILDQALKAGATILINGDLYDAMSGPDDKRGAREMLRDPMTRSTYFDDIIFDGCRYLHKYRHAIALISEGNHEAKVREKHGTDLIERTIAILNERGATIQNGRYAGFVEVHFDMKSGERVNTINVHYHHGSGLSSEAKIVQRAGEYPDSNIIILGHFHDYWSYRINRVRKTGESAIYHDTQLILGVPGLKDDTIDRQSVASLTKYGNASEGWAVESGHRSKPLGAWWIDLTWSRTAKRVMFSAREAILS